MTIPTDRNISVKEFDKLSKYKVPVVVGALGMVKRGVLNYLNSIPGEPSLQELQEIALTTNKLHILRKALSI